MRLLRWLGAAGATVVAVWLLGEGGARWYLHAALSQQWPTPTGELVSIQRQFQPQHASQSALHLEQLASRLGVDICPSSRRNAQPLLANWKAVEIPLKSYLEGALRDPTAGASPLPSPVETYITANAHVIDQIETVILLERPRWEIDIRQGFDAPVPNLLGNLALVRLLIVSAFHHRLAGDYESAWRDLRAAAALSEGLFSRPELISQIIASFEANMLVGAMRHIPHSAPSWAFNWPEENLVHHLTNAATADAWIVYNSFDSAPTRDLFAVLSGRRARPTAGGRVFSLLFSPYLRGSAANAAIAHRAILQSYARLPSCSQTVESLAIDQAIPRWNVFGRVAFPASAIASAFQRLHILLAHVEGTRLILQLRSRTSSKSTPNVKLPCSRRLWAASNTSPVTFVTTVPLARFGTREALDLPQRHVERE